MRARGILAALVVAAALVAPARAQERYSRRVDLLTATTIAGAATTTSTPISFPAGVRYLSLQATFAYGSGGTTAKAYVQTTVDGGATWRDVACFAFTTSAGKKFSAVSAGIALAAAQAVSDGALTDDTILNGLVGDQWRVKVISTGTYAGATSMAVSAVVQ